MSKLVEENITILGQSVTREEAREIRDVLNELFYQSPVFPHIPPCNPAPWEPQWPSPWITYSWESDGTEDKTVYE